MTLEEAAGAVGGEGAVVAVVSMYVLPSGTQGRPPWVFLRVEKSGGGWDDLCWPVYVDLLVESLGKDRPAVQRCGTTTVMTAIVDEGRAVVALLGGSAGSATLALLPTGKQIASSSGNSACFADLRVSSGAGVVQQVC